MSAQEKYNEFLIQLINKGYGNYTANMLPSDLRERHNKLEFLVVLDDIDRGMSPNFVLAELMSLLKHKYDYIIRKYCTRVEGPQVNI